ncbi:POT family MFS transporter [Mucilaginibacter paludis]|uniref:TGF-beta receptor type I/II extracellular region n=1 Tax=Mucilaginibacter paludis DSM 18603 TaxID=714943 RepID=H1Y908_9SPHI|nr:POT family MFS transporter [Mucilaginibacter paludis]EHQ29046.1 TGF-beta receptor type I/II extracellular region [Mucilaginibacter paludis DSM 18603]
MQDTTLSVPVEQAPPRYPKAIPYIIGNEAAERFSFYGMKCILTLFLVAQFFNPTHDPALAKVANAQANESTHFFIALAYALPFVGGLVADWFTGKYKIILYISIVYCIGHLFLSLFDTDLTWFRYGLILIAIGAGGIKSCVSSNVGDQFDKSNESLISKVYGWFYFSINAGSMLSTVMIPYIYNHYGAKWAFGIPGVLMAIATVIFFSGRKLYVRVPPSGVNKNNFVFISLYSLFNIGKKQKGQSLLDVAKGKFDPEKVEGIKAVYRVLAVFAFIPIFWAMWDQSESEWVIQLEQLDKHINLGFAQFDLLSAQVQTVNPVFLLLFIPVFNYGVYPLFDKMGIKTTPLRRIGAGLALTGLSFVIIALIQQSVDAGGHPSVWWQILAFIILSAGEVLVSITGLEYAYTQAPKSMKGTMGAIWLLTVSAGNLLDVYVNNSISSHGYFARFSGAGFYWLFIGLISAFLVLFMFISPRLKERNYITDPEMDLAVAGEAPEK